MSITGGCLCGALRYVAQGSPGIAGYCFCADCRKASGSGFVPFIGFETDAVTFTGTPRQHRASSMRGTEAVRNFCGTCGGLVFGGIVGVDISHTIYGGSLDEPADFVPRIAIFNRDRPLWVPMPAGLIVHHTMPT